MVGTVLVVDDAPPILESMKSFLMTLGIPSEDIRVASDGETAIRLFDRAEPDVVFLDLMMPKMGGEKVAMHMLAVRPKARIILMTGTDPADPLVRDLVSAGVYAVLTKPLRVEAIKDVLRLIETESRALRRI